MEKSAKSGSSGKWLLKWRQVGNLCLQCFDAVGWAAGRASGL